MIISKFSEQFVLFWRFYSELGYILCTVSEISFPPFISTGRLLKAAILPGKKCKKGYLGVQIGALAFIRAWAFIRDFTV